MLNWDHLLGWFIWAKHNARRVQLTSATCAHTHMCDWGQLLVHPHPPTIANNPPATAQLFVIKYKSEARTHPPEPANIEHELKGQRHFWQSFLDRTMFFLIINILVGYLFVNLSIIRLAYMNLPFCQSLSPALYSCYLMKLLYKMILLPSDAQSDV
jgi:hypothetical protein